MRKTDSVKHALTSILQSELETLKVEVEVIYWNFESCMAVIN